MLDERPDEFDQRNLFLHAVLGMISASSRLDAALAEEPVTEAPVAPDDPWLLCVLGMVATRERVMTILGGLEPAGEARSAAATGSGRARPIERILR
jgi:hypothetical protein